MAVKIRLKRVGRKAQPSYRIVVAHSESPRDGSQNAWGTSPAVPKARRMASRLASYDQSMCESNGSGIVDPFAE